MTRTASELWVRLVVGVIASAALAKLFVAALAHARTHVSFAYPWQGPVRSLCMLGLAAVVVVSLVPVLRRGSVGARLVAAVAIALPIGVLVRFLFWLWFL